MWLLWLKLQIMSPLTADKRICKSVSFQHARLSQSQRSIAAQSNQIIAAGAKQSSPEIWALVSTLSQIMSTFNDAKVPQKIYNLRR